MRFPKNSRELISAISNNEMVVAMIHQLNKDFALCNLKKTFTPDLLPIELFTELNEELQGLYANQYDDYLNLLYRVDVSERDILRLKNSHSGQNSDQMAFLILKREYQKVWIKRNFEKL
jgi:hypothetical protein